MRVPVLLIVVAFSSSPVGGGVIRLGTLDANQSWANAINDSGQVVGGTSNGKAFLWTDSGGISEIFLGEAVAINSSGQVVGVSQDGRAVLWDPISGLEDLGVGRAEGINDSGVVVITDQVGLGGGTVHTWDATNGRVALGFSGAALDINNNNQIVGMTPDGEAYVWDSVNGVQRLGKPAGSPSSRAWDISNTGQVVVSPFGINNPPGATSFLWDPLAGTTTLPLLPGTTANFAIGLNDDGSVVGHSASVLPQIEPEFFVC